MVEQTLRDLGLNPNEVKIYLSLLPLEKSPASTLGYRTKLERTTARYTCRQLVKKGVIAEMRSGNTFYYRAESPDKLLYLLESEKKELQEKEAQTQRIMGMLKGMANPKTKLPRIEFYEGKEGVIKLYDQILEIGKDLDSFEDGQDMAAFIPEYIPRFIQERKKRGIHNRVICPADTKTNKESKKELRKTRTVPHKELPFSCDVKICGDQISLFSFQKGSEAGIAIRHQDLAENFRRLFEYNWKKLSEKD